MPIISGGGGGGLPAGITSRSAGFLELDATANSSGVLVVSDGLISYFAVGTDGSLTAGGGTGGGNISLTPSQLQAVLAATADSGIVVRDDHTEIDLPAGGNMRVYNANFDLLFTVDEADGSVHIKTGTTVIADL